MNKTNLTELFFIFSVIILIISVGKLEDIEKYEEKKELAKDIIQKKYLTEIEGDGGAEYSCKTDNMVIYINNGSYWWNKEKFNHEWAHSIWCKNLNKSLKAEWELIFNNTIDVRFFNDTEKEKLLFNGSPYFVTDYSMNGSSENFAESFRYYVDNDKIDDERKVFMDKYVKKLI